MRTDRGTSWDGSTTDEQTRAQDDPRSDLITVTDLVGRKWNPVVVYHLSRDGPLGFSDLEARIDGISTKVLSETREKLEEKDVLSREVISEQPFRVEYAPTEAVKPLLQSCWPIRVAPEVRGVKTYILAAMEAGTDNVSGNLTVVEQLRPVGTTACRVGRSHGASTPDSHRKAVLTAGCPQPATDTPPSEFHPPRTWGE